MFVINFADTSLACFVSMKNDKISEIGKLLKRSTKLLP